ncbi:hypothetical protein ONE63_006423 [Megalurothrips usitatus]|uniref:Endocuticle structural glycoprotein SgAbd-2 n=1 Tax=Megalurothrips usitatus TaxID=439358 RepID=A0AAV7XXH8_9NEOP|nr:hypothetical protein ONE63_006423 [Megalurothrips usitatus]
MFTGAACVRRCCTTGHQIQQRQLRSLLPQQPQCHITNCLTCGRQRTSAYSELLCAQIALALVAVAAARPDVSHLLGQQHHHAPPPAILRQVQETSEQGDYKFKPSHKAFITLSSCTHAKPSCSFKTENGIEAVGQAQLKNAGSKDEALVSEGTYSYVGDDGQTYSVNWVADEFGFRASGAHIPEIPEEIKRGLEQSANEPEDDGQYREDPNSYDRPQQPFRQ